MQAAVHNGTVELHVIQTNVLEPAVHIALRVRSLFTPHLIHHKLASRGSYSPLMCAIGLDRPIPSQLRRVRNSLAPHERYLRKLVARMDALGFDSGDVLRRSAATASRAIEQLIRTALSGVARHGRDREASDDPERIGKQGG